jgi:hypothetical protein
MDEFSATTLILGILFLIIAGSIFAITGSRSVPIVGPFIPTGPGMMGFFGSALKTTGSWTPYVILLGGVGADIFLQEFRYTLLTVISGVAMVVGIVFQVVFYGGVPKFLPALTVGTAAALTYLMQDAWTQPQLSTEKRVIATIGGLVGMVVTALVSMGTGGMFTTPYMNEAVSIIMGAGIGELAWAIIWNTMPDRLPLVNK